MEKLLKAPIDKSDYLRGKSWGLSAMIDLYGCDHGLIRSFEDIRRFVDELCLHIDMKKYGDTLVERFAEGYYEGVSMMQFIETSSITAHFDENEDRAFIDVFSCKYFDPEKAARFCQEFFKAKKVKLNALVRN